VRLKKSTPDRTIKKKRPKKILEVIFINWQQALLSDEETARVANPPCLIADPNLDFQKPLDMGLDFAAQIDAFLQNMC
jgi:hypothetical protein